LHDNQKAGLQRPVGLGDQPRQVAELKIMLEAITLHRVRILCMVFVFDCNVQLLRPMRLV
jgi:hypothetical protein